MTAEIAILNKTAVALAADSAVTISSGNAQLKTFDTADKLFELSIDQPIGIMLYNGMSFMGIPLPALVKDFRDDCGSFETVEQAAESFLSYLNEVGLDSSEVLLNGATVAAVRPILEIISERFEQRLLDRMIPSRESEEGEPPAASNDQVDISVVAEEELEKIVSQFMSIWEIVDDAMFVGKSSPPNFSKKYKELTGEIIDDVFHSPPEQIRDQILGLSREVLRKGRLSSGKTGLVFCGFGEKEKFPTLLSFEIDGMVLGSLKYVQTNVCDIDREGTRASVIPFAQKDMVDRFVFGLDEGVQFEISNFCQQIISEFTGAILDQIPDPKEDLANKIREAEEVFLSSLEEDAFQNIRSISRKEIDDMVEFMPKQEMARMAEAMIEITSLKRRVSKGFETVGGPIDVAVISKSEGFVWIKRKHYFPAEANARFFERIRIGMNGQKGEGS